jgi:hypothetical protein
MQSVTRNAVRSCVFVKKREEVSWKFKQAEATQLTMKYIPGNMEFVQYLAL